MRVLVTGATGFVGGLAARRLAAEGHEVRCLVRNPGAPAARALAAAGFELQEGDVLDAGSLRGAGEGCEAALYLVHSMGAAAGAHFASADLRAAENFGRMARTEGVGHVLYLGGLGGEEPGSEHLRSRHETAGVLAEHGPPLTYFRAAMVIGARSDSYRILRHLVRRLPAMIGPAWLRTRTQPIGIEDVLAYFSAALARPEVTGTVEIGGADVVTYQALLGTMASVMGLRPRPVIPVPLLSPSLSSHWIGFVTPVSPALARPLVEGLATETVVMDPEPARRLGVRPVGAGEALAQAWAEERAAAP